MDMFENMCLFVCVVEVGSFIVVVKEIDVIIVQVLCVVLNFEVYVQMCLLYCMICCFGLIESGECYFECVKLIFVEIDYVNVEVCNVLLWLSGKMCIYVMMGFGQSYVVLLIVCYQEDNFDVLVELMLVQWMLNLVEEGYDVLIVIVLQLFDLGYVVQICGMSCSVFVVLCEYLVWYGMLQMFDELLNYVCLCFDKFVLLVGEWCLECSDGEEIVYELQLVLFQVNVLDVLCVVVCVGCGIVCVVLYMVFDDICEGCLICVLFEYWLQMVSVYVVYVMCCYFDVKICIFFDYLCMMFMFVLENDLCEFDWLMMEYVLSSCQCV